MAAYEIITLVEGAPQLRAPGTGNTYSAPRALALTPEALTGTAATTSLDITQTWNTTGTPTALKLRVTDTASNAASLLLDVGTVAGGSMFNISKGGNVTSYGTVLNLGTGSSYWVGQANGTQYFQLYNDFFSVTKPFSLSSDNDTILQRDAANTLALRNSTNAQAFRTYGTWTDASNYRRVALTMTTAGVASLSAEGAGTGASGNVLHISSLPTSNPGPGILWNNAGTPAIGT